jgi:hypothetical protein
MIARNTTKWLAALLLTTSLAAPAVGQNAMGPFFSPFENDAFCGGCDYDAQWFSPVDFDFNCQPMRRDCGYFFRYDKLSWAATGERNTIGDPSVQALSEIMVTDDLAESFNVTTSNIRSADLQYAIINGLQDVPPIANFAWGERYELGYFNGGSGWLVSILDGPEVNSRQTFGNGPEVSGFGSIHVNFATPDNFLLGFRDYGGTGIEH